MITVKSTFQRASKGQTRQVFNKLADLCHDSLLGQEFPQEAIQLLIEDDQFSDKIKGDHLAEMILEELRSAVARKRFIQDGPFVHGGEGCASYRLLPVFTWLAIANSRYGGVWHEHHVPMSIETEPGLGLTRASHDTVIAFARRHPNLITLIKEGSGILVQGDNGPERISWGTETDLATPNITPMQLFGNNQDDWILGWEMQTSGKW